MDSSEAHVAMITFPFTSHPFIFLNLARKLAIAAPQVQFSFFNTAKSNASILSAQSTDLPTNIKFYNFDDGLPGGFEYTESVQNLIQQIVCYFNIIPANLQHGLNQAEKESGKRITCFLTDAFLSFSVSKRAEELNLPWVAFWALAPYALPSYMHMELLTQLYSKAQAESDRPGEQTVDLIPGLSSIRFSDLPENTFQLDPKSSSTPHLVRITRKLGQASAIVLNAFEEITPTLLIDDLKSKFKNLLYAGCLSMPELASGLPSSHSGSDGDVTGCLSWLDGKQPASVAYISFGTAVELCKEEVVALAEAIEESGIPFLWSLKDNSKEHLPDGFLERISLLGIGKVVPWAPQSRVLVHPSIGVHVTHCGYNALFESILGGVPMICRSGWQDNHMNAKMVEEVWGIGVRVEGGVITKRGMLNNLETIFHPDKGKKIREATDSLKEVLLKAAGPDGVAAKHFRTLLQIIISKE